MANSLRKWGLIHRVKCRPRSACANVWLANMFAFCQVFASQRTIIIDLVVKTESRMNKEIK